MPKHMHDDVTVAAWWPSMQKKVAETKTYADAISCAGAALIASLKDTGADTVSLMMLMAGLNACIDEAKKAHAASAQTEPNTQDTIA